MPNFSGIWSTAQQFQAKGQAIWPSTPGAPTIGTATAGTNKCASVTFTAPTCTGKYPTGVTGYKVISTPGCFTGTGASSPVTVTGLTAGTSYTFKAQATNGNGYGTLSAASNSVTATLTTCATYTTAGSYSWVAPTGVTSVAVVAIGGGAYGCYNGTYAGGPGGGLGYKNGVSVTPGNSYTVVVGTAGNGCCGGGGGRKGTDSYFINTSTVKGGGGAQTGTGLGGTYTGDGGGNGGNGGLYAGGLTSGPGGGGAGGYSGNGGNGGATLIGRPGSAGAACSGAGGGGGAGYRGCCGCNRPGGMGGGVGIYGKGTTGAGGTGGYPTPNTNGGFGGAGSGGSNALYGGGGGYGRCCAGQNGRGAVRIVWCKCGARGTPSFPSTNVGA